MESARVGIRDAKIHLSRFLEIVKSGGEVVITDHGKPVGKIVPFQSSEMSLSDRVKYLEDSGIIVPKIGGKEPKPFTPIPIPVPDSIAQEFLREDRDAGL